MVPTLSAQTQWSDFLSKWCLILIIHIDDWHMLLVCLWASTEHSFLKQPAVFCCLELQKVCSFGRFLTPAVIMCMQWTAHADTHQQSASSLDIQRWPWNTHLASADRSTLAPIAELRTMRGQGRGQRRNNYVWSTLSWLPVYTSCSMLRRVATCISGLQDWALASAVL